MQTPPIWLAVSCAQAEARIQRDRLYVAFGTGDGVSEGNHERKHQSDIDMVEQCHHKFRIAYYLLWYLKFWLSWCEKDSINGCVAQANALLGTSAC